MPWGELTVLSLRQTKKVGQRSPVLCVTVFVLTVGHTDKGFTQAKSTFSVPCKKILQEKAKVKKGFIH